MLRSRLQLRVPRPYLDLEKFTTSLEPGSRSSPGSARRRRAEDRIAEVVAVRMERNSKEVDPQRGAVAGCRHRQIRVPVRRPRQQRNEDGAAGTWPPTTRISSASPAARALTTMRRANSPMRVCKSGCRLCASSRVPGPHRADARYQPTPARAGHRKQVRRRRLQPSDKGAPAAKEIQHRNRSTRRAAARSPP